MSKLFRKLGGDFWDRVEARGEELKKEKEEYSVEIFMGINGIKSAIFSALKNMKNESEFVSFGVSGNRKEEISNIFHQLSSITKKKKIKTSLSITKR